MSKGTSQDVTNYEEDGEEYYDVEDDKYSQLMSYGDKLGRKTDRELSRLKWNGEIPNKGNTENLGKGQRSAARKHK